MAITIEQLATDMHRAAEVIRNPRVLVDALLKTTIGDLKEGMQRGVDVNDRPFATLAIPRVGTGGGGPLVHHGGLLNSLVAGPGHVERVSDTGFTVGTNRVGANILNQGGEIRPVRGQFLAIPRTPEAKAAGSARNFPRPLVCIIGPVGGVLIERSKTPVRKQSRKEVVQYILTRKVRIPMREFVGVGQRLLGKLGLVCQDVIGGAVDGRVF